MKINDGRKWDSARTLDHKIVGADSYIRPMESNSTIGIKNPQQGRKWDSARTLLFIILMVILMYRFIDKESLIRVIRQSLPYREAGLMAGILVGDKTGFDKNFYEQLKNSGLIHLVVVSGSNVMLLVGGLIEFGARFLGRKKTIIGGLIIGWGYAGLVEWEVPVVRAILLVSIFYLAQLVGRKYNLVRGIILAVVMMILADVRVLTSVSFWLSMMAFLAIVTFRNLKNIFSSKIIFQIINILGQTLWVSVWITPIMGLTFGKVSLLSPITNLLVVGIVEVITMIGAGGVLVGLVVPIIGKGILWLCLPWLKYLAIVVVEGGSDLGVGKINFNWLMLIGWYLILGYWLNHRK